VDFGRTRRRLCQRETVEIFVEADFAVAIRVSAQNVNLDADGAPRLLRFA
jgi:thiamine monophosphate synthase